MLAPGGQRSGNEDPGRGVLACCAYAALGAGHVCSVLSPEHTARSLIWDGPGLFCREKMAFMLNWPGPVSFALFYYLISKRESFHGRRPGKPAKTGEHMRSSPDYRLRPVCGAGCGMVRRDCAKPASGLRLFSMEVTGCGRGVCLALKPTILNSAVFFPWDRASRLTGWRNIQAMRALREGRPAGGR